MAETFRAEEPRDAGDPRLVVIKRMLPSIAVEPGARTMFEEEARLGSCVNHDNVVRVLGFGDERGQPYLALEYVPGLDLWRLTRWLTQTNRTLGLDLSVFIVRELLAGLHAVHEACDLEGRALGIVHRDVSPSNVLLSIHGDVKLSDFGIAQARFRQQRPEANARAKGKLGYLAPEQVRGQPADRRADVFAAAAIAAELLMSEPLFTGNSELAVLLAIRDANVHRFEALAASLPNELRCAVVNALARDPVERTSTARAFSDMLAPLQQLPTSVLRLELAGIVAHAQASRRPSGGFPTAAISSRPTLMPKTVEFDSARSSAPPTSELPQLDYVVRMSNAERLGPLSFAKMVEAIATMRVDASAFVSVGGGPFEPIHTHNDLARYLPVSNLAEITVERPIPGEPDRGWNLREHSFAAVLGSIVLENETGLLLCERGDIRKEIYLKRGAPEFVSSNLASELLGEFLVARGEITRGELDIALGMMSRFDGRLGDTLTALELVEPVRLFGQIAAQVEEKILELFTWRTGKVTFWRGVATRTASFPLDLDPWRLLVDGMDRQLAECDTIIPIENSRVIATGNAFHPQLPERAQLVLVLAAKPIEISIICSRLADPQGRDRWAGRREVALLLALGSLEFA
jgi:serine/threonine-protein kinase